MQEAERLRAMISRMDIAEIQEEANRINGLAEIKLDQVKLYFEKLGRNRIGDHMTHLKRRIYLILKGMNMNNDDIAYVLRVDRSTCYHYERMTPNKEIEKEVSKNYKYWIASGLYPIPLHKTDSNSRYYTTYKLVTEPNWKSEYTKTETLVKKDDILLDLN